MPSRLSDIRSRYARVAFHPALRPAWIVFALGFFLSVAGLYLVRAATIEKANLTFNQLAKRVIDRTRLTMATYEQVLRGGVGMMRIEPDISLEKFQGYVRALEIEKDYPGLQGIGYAAFVRPDEKAAFEQRMRRDGFRDYEIKPPGPRPIYSAIVFLEPLDWRNRRAIGYDMYSDAVRREAMDRARDDDRPAMSSRVILVQETGQDVQPGFLLYLPLYKTGASVETPQDRARAIKGYVYAPFRAVQLMNYVMSAERAVWNAMGIAVYDGTAIDDANLLFKTGNVEARRDEADYRSTMKLEMYGRTWTFSFASSNFFDIGVSHASSVLTCVSGLLLTLLLTAFIATKSYRQVQLARSNEQMALMTRELSHRVKNTLSIVQVIANRSLSGERSLADGREAFLRRLHALARAHSLLLDSLWNGASLASLARQELAPFPERVVISGPDILLNANSAQTMALVLHELATNAAKYGALTSDKGRITVRWRVTRAGIFEFDWRETGGPPVTEPAHRGFGRVLLDQRLGHGSEAPVISFEESGLKYHVAAPLTSIVETNDEDDTMQRLMEESLNSSNTDNSETR